MLTFRDICALATSPIEFPSAATTLVYDGWSRIIIQAASALPISARDGLDTRTM
jgi:hypothetical protein